MNQAPRQDQTDDRKRMASGSYRRQIKRMTQLIVGLTGQRKLPRQPARPARDLAKQAAYDERWAARPTKASARFWIDRLTFEERRRQTSPSERLVDALKAADANAAPKTSLAY